MGELCREGAVSRAGVMTGVGERSAAGAARRKACRERCDRWSAMQLLVPGICTMQRWKLWVAAVKNNAWTRLMMCGHLLVPFSHTAMTAWLSQ